MAALRTLLDAPVGPHPGVQRLDVDKLVRHIVDKSERMPLEDVDTVVLLLCGAGTLTSTFPRMRPHQACHAAKRLFDAGVIPRLEHLVCACAARNAPLVAELVSRLRGGVASREDNSRDQWREALLRSIYPAPCSPAIVAELLKTLPVLANSVVFTDPVSRHKLKPLHLALLAGDCSAVEALGRSQQRVDPLEPCPEYFLTGDLEDLSNLSPLDIVAELGNHKLAQSFIRAFPAAAARCCSPPPSEGSGAAPLSPSPLYRAYYRGHLAVCRVFLSALPLHSGLSGSAHLNTWIGIMAVALLAGVGASVIPWLLAAVDGIDQQLSSRVDEDLVVTSPAGQSSQPDSAEGMTCLEIALAAHQYDAAEQLLHAIGLRGVLGMRLFTSAGDGSPRTKAIGHSSWSSSRVSAFHSLLHAAGMVDGDARLNCFRRAWHLIRDTDAELDTNLDWVCGAKMRLFFLEQAQPASIQPCLSPEKLDHQGSSSSRPPKSSVAPCGMSPPPAYIQDPVAITPPGIAARSSEPIISPITNESSVARGPTEFASPLNAHITATPMSRASTGATPGRLNDSSFLTVEGTPPAPTTGRQPEGSKPESVTIIAPRSSTPADEDVTATMSRTASSASGAPAYVTVSPAVSRAVGISTTSIPLLDDVAEEELMDAELACFKASLLTHDATQIYMTEGRGAQRAMECAQRISLLCPRPDQNPLIILHHIRQASAVKRPTMQSIANKAVVIAPHSKTATPAASARNSSFDQAPRPQQQQQQQQQDRQRAYVRSPGSRPGAGLAPPVASPGGKALSYSPAGSRSPMQSQQNGQQRNSRSQLSDSGHSAMNGSRFPSHLIPTAVPNRGDPSHPRSETRSKAVRIDPAAGSRFGGAQPHKK